MNNTFSLHINCLSGELSVKCEKHFKFDLLLQRPRHVVI